MGSKNPAYIPIYMAILKNRYKMNHKDAKKTQRGADLLLPLCTATAVLCLCGSFHFSNYFLELPCIAAKRPQVSSPSPQ
jgi:hypothetical protein